METLYYLVAGQPGNWQIADVDTTIEYCQGAAKELPAADYWMIFTIEGCVVLHQCKFYDQILGESISNWFLSYAWDNNLIAH